MAPSDPVPQRTAAERAAYLRTVVECLARQIAEGETPIVDDMFTEANAIDLEEMRRLAALCDERGLPAEAARIRRWLNP